MSFADEIRNQARSKEEIAQEAAEEAAKRESQERERHRIHLEREFRKITETVKSRIAEAAQSGNYRTEGGVKVIQDTLEVYLDRSWLPASIKEPDIRLLAGGGLEVVHQTLKEKRPWLGTPKFLHRILLKANDPDVFKGAYHAFMDGLRRDGIDTSFVLEWDIPCKCKYVPYVGTEYGRRTYQIPLEQLSEGFIIQDWFLMSDGPSGQPYYEGEARRFRCTYQFRF